MANIVICDICKEILKEIKYTVYIKTEPLNEQAIVKREGQYWNKRDTHFENELKLFKDYEVCEGCKKVLDRILELRIKEIKKEKKKVKQLWRRRNRKGKKSNETK